MLPRKMAMRVPAFFPRATALIAAALSSLFFVAEASADVPDDCPGLGAALVEHSCFHSTHGPFATRTATPGTEIVEATPDLNSVHTEYRVGLAGRESSVTYEPTRTGAFSVFLGADVPLRITRNGVLLPEVITFDEGTGCDALPVSRVFELKTRAAQIADEGAFKPYQLIFGPTSSQSVVVVIEYVDDFLIDNGRDADEDGYGNPSDVIRSVCVPPDGYVQNKGDCDDSDPTVHPGAVERCGDELDQNCNGLPDDVGLSCSAGEGACRRTGDLACDNGNTFCSATPGESSTETCNGVDDDCNGRIDDAVNLCSEPDRPTCVREAQAAFCGCLLDLDCGPNDSGRICDLGERRCTAGCSRESGRNGCPAGYACQSTDENAGRCVAEVPDDAGVPPEGGAGGESAAASGTAGVAGARAGNGGQGGGGGTPVGGGAGTEQSRGGAPADDGGQGGDSEREDPRRIVETRGCGCRVGASPNSSGGGMVLLVGLLSALALRRQRSLQFGPKARRSLLALALLTSACGGRSIQGDSDSDGGGHDHPHAGHGHTHAGSASRPPASGTGGTSGGGGGSAGSTSGTSHGGASVAGSTSGGSAGTGGSACIPELGEDPVAHACSHMTSGPFIPVAALGAAHGTTANVSTIQTAFEVDVVEPGARLSYVASRSGTHVVLTDREVALSVLDASSVKIPSLEFTVSGCAAIQAGLRVSLVEGQAYAVQIADAGARSFNVFIEHMETFGDAAWKRRCAD
jgi:MYXO-CTERM domain-containing protein